MTWVGACTGGGDGGTSTSASNTLTLPAGAAAGHWLIAVTVQNTGTSTVTGVNGWTTLDGPETFGSILRGYALKYQLTSADITAGSVASPAWNSGGRTVTFAECHSGLDSTTPFETVPAATVANASTATAPAASTTVNGSDAITLVGARVASGTGADPGMPAGYTDDGVARTAFGSGVNISAAAAHLTSPGTAGAVGGGTVTSSPAASHLIVFTVATRAAAAATSANLTGAAAGATTGAVAGTVAAVMVAALAGIAGASTTAAPAGTVSAVRVASVAGTAAASTTSSPAGTVTTVQNAAVVGVAATSSTDAPAGTVSAGAARLLDQGFEAFTDGANVTSASGFTPSLGTGTTLKYASDRVAAGLRSMKATYSSAAVYGTATFAPQSTAFLRWYDYKDTTPAALTAIAGLLTSTPSVATRGQVAIDTSGRPTLRSGTSLVTTGTTNVIGKWVRYEWEPTGATQTLRVYIGANVNGTTPDETLTGAYLSGGFDSLRLGVLSSTGNAGSSWVDEVAVDTASQPGPVSTSASVTGVPAAATTAAVVGSVAGVRVVTVTGASSTSATAAVPGAVTAVQAASSASVSGSIATSTTGGVAGAVTAAQVATVTGAAAASSTGATAGTVAAQAVATVDGALAATTTDAPAGTVAPVQVVDLAGVPAETVTDAAPGDVSTQTSALVTPADRMCEWVTEDRYAAWPTENRVAAWPAENRTVPW